VLITVGRVAAVTRPRGPLPRRVYWARRLLVLGVACALVFGIATLLDYGSDDAPNTSQASTVAGSPSPSATETRKKPGNRKQAEDDEGKDEKEKEKLATPQGPCDDSDVLVTPSVREAHAGSPVKIVLELTTAEADACFWEVSPDTVFVNIDSEEGTLWSSQHCSDAVPTESVVPRKEHAAKVRFWWNAKESDEDCSPWTDWVLAGSYTAVAAARGSVTPVATGFLLGGAIAPTITETPTPTKKPKQDQDEPDRDEQDQDDPSPTPTTAN
jgi:hypothetical protein